MSKRIGGHGQVCIYVGELRDITDLVSPECMDERMPPSTTKQSLSQPWVEGVWQGSDYL